MWFKMIFIIFNVVFKNVKKICFFKIALKNKKKLKPCKNFISYSSGFFEIFRADLLKYTKKIR